MGRTKYISALPVKNSARRWKNPFEIPKSSGLEKARTKIILGLAGSCGQISGISVVWG